MDADTIAELAGAADNPAVVAAMAPRAESMAASQANQRAVLTPRDPGGLAHTERAALACRIARLNGDAALAARYAPAAGGASALADPAQPAPSDARLAALLRHVDLVTQRPQAATRGDIAALRAAGLDDADIVRLSQLIAFVNYQLRVVAGLRLIGAAA